MILIAMAATPAMAKNAGIIISASGPVVAGSVVVINILVTGDDPASLAATFELNGVPLPASSVVKKRSPSGDGSFDYHVKIPAGAAGGTLAVTAAAGSSFGSDSFPVTAPSSPLSDG